jgi:hypothetical protein
MVSEGRQSIAGNGTKTWPAFRHAMRQYLRAPGLALGLSFLFGVFFTALLWGVGSFGPSWSAIRARLSFQPEVPIGGAPSERAPVASGLTLPMSHADTAFRYSVWALPNQEGEPLRPSLLVGRFQTREEADDALKRMQTLEGLQRLEVIETNSPPREER